MQGTQTPLDIATVDVGEPSSVAFTLNETSRGMNAEAPAAPQAA